MNKTCPVCGKAILNPTSHQKYCSEKCKRKAYGEINKDKIAKRTNRYSRYKDTAPWIYGHKCAICGWSASRYSHIDDIEYRSYGCHAHHIVPVREGGTDEYENLILLCPNHHKMADMGLISREELREYTYSNEEAQQILDNISRNEKEGYDPNKIAVQLDGSMLDRLEFLQREMRGLLVDVGKGKLYLTDIYWIIEYLLQDVEGMIKLCKKNSQKGWMK